MIRRRHFIQALAASAAWPGIARAAWPEKPIRIVVPYAPGGFTDIVSRLLAAKLTTRLGQPVVVENKAGASTIIAAEHVARSAPDGHTLIMAVTTTLSTNPLLFKKLPYKPGDFVPIALTAMTPFVLSAHPGVPAGSVKELIALAKANPGSLNLATLGTGSSTHLVGAMFNSLAGIDLPYVPYKGTGPTLTDLTAGHVQLYFDGIATSAPLFRAGKLKGLAITSETRSPAAPQVPTFAEAGLPGMTAASWFGLLAPAGTPAAVVETLNQATNEALQAPDVRARIEQDGATAPQLGARQFGELIDRHTQQWSRVVAPLNIQLD